MVPQGGEPRVRCCSEQPRNDVSAGRALPKDDGLALQWFRRAAEQGYASAQYNVGLIYESGGTAVKDENQAIMWFKKAAEGGYSQARDHLQVMCDDGVSAACS